MNPAGFDYQRYLFAKKISATGYVKNRKTNKIIGYSSKKYAIIIFRTHLIQKILNALGKSKFTGLIIALLVGSRNYIPADQLNTFQNTGVIHLIAISGLHISLIMGFSYLLTILIVKKIYFITSKRSAFDIACIISLIFGFIYSMIAGFPLSTQRAFIMISVFMLASLMRRNIKPFHGFLLALFIVLIINPLSILSTGFWLSFCAVFILIYSFYRRDKITFFKKWIKPQIAIAIGLMPILLISFNQISTVSLIANTIAIPVFSFMVIPLVLIGGFLLIFSSFGKYILILANKVITSIWPILHWLAKKHFALWHHSAQNHLTLIFSIIGTLFILAPRFPGKWLGIICLLPLIFFKSVIKPNTLYFTLLDVGQGLSAVIKTAHHTLLYDTGIKFNENSNSGKSIIIPYLTKMGINKIDVLVISHGDNDHIGGAKSVLSSIKVNQILTSVPNKFSQKNTTPCHSGQKWNWDGINFKIISPLKNTNLKGNEASCVLKITDGKNSILLTGDIERNTEEILIKKYKNSLKSSILVAPHHGSNSSSSKLFIKYINPKYVLFPTGFLNRYHFPQKSVLLRYKKIHATPLNTAISGAITFKIDKTKISTPIKYRETSSHFWN